MLVRSSRLDGDRDVHSQDALSHWPENAGRSPVRSVLVRSRPHWRARCLAGELSQLLRAHSPVFRGGIWLQKRSLTRFWQRVIDLRFSSDYAGRRINGFVPARSLGFKLSQQATTYFNCPGFIALVNAQPGNLRRRASKFLGSISSWTKMRGSHGSGWRYKRTRSPSARLYLLEVNSAPSLSTPTALDEEIKSSMLGEDRGPRFSLGSGCQCLLFPLFARPSGCFAWTVPQKCRAEGGRGVQEQGGAVLSPAHPKSSRACCGLRCGREDPKPQVPV